MASNKQGEPTILDAVSVVAAKLSDSGLSFEATEDFLQGEKQLNEYFSTRILMVYWLMFTMFNGREQGYSTSLQDRDKIYKTPFLCYNSHRTL